MPLFTLLFACFLLSCHRGAPGTPANTLLTYIGQDLASELYNPGDDTIGSDGMGHSNHFRVPHLPSAYLERTSGGFFNCSVTREEKQTMLFPPRC
jgi:hypothetical protein